MGGCCDKEKKPSEATQRLLDGHAKDVYEAQNKNKNKLISPSNGSHSPNTYQTSPSSAYRAPSDSSGGQGGSSQSYTDAQHRSGAPKASTASAAIPMNPSASSPSKQAEKELNILMKHVVLDQKTLQSIVEHAETEYLEVDRSLAGVTRDDPEDPSSIAFISAVRGVDVAADSLRIGVLPKPAFSSPETIVSALTVDALPADVLSRVRMVSSKVGQAADTVTLRDTGLPIVSGFSRPPERKTA